MVDADQVSQTSKLGHWTLNTQYTFAGADTGLVIPSALLGSIASYGADIVIEGISVFVFRAGGGVVVNVYVYARDGAGSAQHFLSEYTTVGNLGTKHFAPLEIATTIVPGTDMINVYMTTQALDIVSISAWGRYLRPPEEPETKVTSIWELLFGGGDL